MRYLRQDSLAQTCEAMAGTEGSGLSDRGSWAPPGLGENLLSEVGLDFKIGSLQTEKGGSAVSCQVIGIAMLEGGFLVAVPHAAWHRTGARRYLPADSLVRPVLAEVLAAGEGDRREAHPAWCGLELFGQIWRSRWFSGLQTRQLPSGQARRRRKSFSPLQVPGEDREGLRRLCRLGRPSQL